MTIAPQVEEMPAMDLRHLASLEGVKLIVFLLGEAQRRHAVQELADDTRAEDPEFF